MPKHLDAKPIGPRGIPTPKPLDPDHSFDECEGCEIHIEDWWAYRDHGQRGWIHERHFRRPQGWPSSVSLYLCPYVCPDHTRHCDMGLGHNNPHACVFCEDTNV